jgi:four helix bundle protein
MATIEKFEDIEAWQKARELTQEVYQITNQGNFSKDFGLRDQIRRAAIMPNIAEGFGRGGNKEILQFLSMAKGSSSEVQAQLYIALDANYIKEDQFRLLYDLAQSSGKLIGGFICYLQ